MTIEQFREDYNYLEDIDNFLADNGEDSARIFESAIGRYVCRYGMLNECILDSVQHAIDNNYGWQNIYEGLQYTATEDDGYFFIESGDYCCGFTCIDSDDYYVDEIKDYIIEQYTNLFDDGEVINEEESIKKEIKLRKIRLGEAKTEATKFGADMCVFGLYNSV